jgi:hypothetical protein
MEKKMMIVLGGDEQLPTVIFSLTNELNPLPFVLVWAIIHERTSLPQ